ncbi:MAG: hypothetical protein ABJG78_21310 [Cyclobacteriaceae bacterium]
MNNEVLGRLEAKYRNRKKRLVMASLLFSVFFVVTALLAQETMLHTVVQGLFLSVGFVFVSFISESEKKLRAVRKHKK